MEPQFQSSFIPKRPITSESTSFVGQTASIGIFSLLANVVITLTLASCVGLFIYTRYLNGQITEAHNNILAAQAVFQPDTIQSLISTSNKLASAQKLLEKHTAPSEIFTALQSLAYKKVRFGDFTYTNKNNLISITMQVEASSYNALAQQANVFNQSPFILQPVFSEFKVLDTGNISAKLNANIDSSLVSYKKMLQVLSNEQQTTPTSPVDTSASSTPQ